MTGLRKHVPQDQLQGARVMVITNLKTAKLAGQLSEAMILCGTGGDKVVLSAAPEGAEVGTRVFAAGAGGPASAGAGVAAIRQQAPTRHTPA